MKKFILVILILNSLALLADPPQLTWRIANPRIIKVTQQRIEFEIQVKADQNGTYYSSGQFMLYFNNDAISYTSDLHWTIIPSGISAQTHPDIGNKYVIARVRSGAYPNTKVLIGLTPTDEAVIDEDPASGYLAEITTAWQTYCKVQCRITDYTALAGLFFYEQGTNGQNFYLESAGNEVGYANPSLYENLDLEQAYLGRIYSSSYGWSQYGGSTDNVQYIDWSAAVNTSVWEGNPEINGENYQIQSLRIHNGANLVIQPSASLSVLNTLSNETGNDGLLLKSNASGTASLIHHSDNVNATVERYIIGNPDVLQQAYHLVAVPITQNIVSGVFLGSYLYRFDTPTQSWINMGSSTTNPLQTDQGYMIYYPGDHIIHTYTGPMYNDEVRLEVSYHSANGYTGFNLVPNPFPSAINWDSSEGWSKTNINDAIWIWNPTMKNYSSYGDQVAANGATQFIPTGQSFFVKANASNPELSVNNNARLHSDQAFYKDQSENSGLFRMKAFANNYQDELIVRLSETGNESYNPVEDRDKMFGASDSPQLYSLSSDNVFLTLNTIPVNLAHLTIPIGFQLDTSSTATLVFNNMQSIPDNISLILEDLVLGQMIDLRINESYTFQHNPSNIAERFLLHFEFITNTHDIEAYSPNIWSSKNKVFFHIPSSDGQKMNVHITDVLGKTLINKEVLNNGSNCMEIYNYEGIVIIRIQLENISLIDKLYISR